MAESEHGTKRSLRDLLRVGFRRYKLFFLGASLAAVLILFASSRLWPMKYTGTATFERRNELAAGAAGFEQYKLSLEVDFKKKENIRKAIDDIELRSGLEPAKATSGPDKAAAILDPPPSDTTAWRLSGKTAKEQQDIINDLANRIAIRWDARSEQKDLISVSIVHPDRWFAAQFPNTLVANYMESTGDEIIKGLERQKGLAEDLLKNAKNTQKTLNTQMNAFISKTGGVTPQNLPALEQDIVRLDAEIDTSRQQQGSAEQKIAWLKEMLKGPEAASSQPTTWTKGPNPRWMDLDRKISDLKDQLERAIGPGRMTEEHPAVKELRRQIKVAEKEQDETPSSTTQSATYGGPNSQRESISMALAEATADLTSVTHGLERAENRQKAFQELKKNFSQAQDEYNRIKSDIEDTTREANRWQGELDKLNASLGPEMAHKGTHLASFQQAEVQYRPSSPTLWMVLATAVLGGLACGGGLVFLANALDRSIGTTEEAASYFNVPIHGVISEIITPRQHWVRRARFWVLAPTITTVLLVAMVAAAFSVYFWLDSPDSYSKWQSSPMRAVQEKIQEKLKG